MLLVKHFIFEFGKKKNQIMKVYLYILPVPDQQFGGPGAVRKMSPPPPQLRKLQFWMKPIFFTGGVNSK